MSRRPLFLLACCLAVGVTLLVWGQRSALNPAKSEDAAPGQVAPISGSVSALSVFKDKVAALPEGDQAKVAQLQAALDSLDGQEVQAAGIWKSLSSFWITRQDYLGGAVCLDLALALAPNAEDSRDAGLFYGSAGHALEGSDSVLLSFCRKRSVELLAKALEAQPQDLDLKADWANALVLSSPAPMQGVQALMDIVRQEPKHLKAHSHLARLAIESRQFPKAIQRYKNLLTWYPGLGAAYLGLGEAYYLSGSKDSAVFYLQQYRGLVQDPETQQQIDQYLQELNP